MSMSQVPASFKPDRRNTARSQLGSINTRIDSPNPSQASLPYRDTEKHDPPTGYFVDEPQKAAIFSPATRQAYDVLLTPAPDPPKKNLFTYQLPSAVASVRDGWQLTSQSGAVVSGLLAAVASQLLGLFEGNENLSPEGARGIIIGTCYAAIFLNINATIGSFVLTDHLGELGFEAAQLDMSGHLEQLETVGNNHSGVNHVLKEFGAGCMWKYMLVHWLVTFYLGILSLIVSVLTYVLVAEGRAIKICMCFVVGLTLFPTSVFILCGSSGKKDRRRIPRRKNTS